MSRAVPYRPLVRGVDGRTTRQAPFAPVNEGALARRVVASTGGHTGGQRSELSSTYGERALVAETDLDPADHQDKDVRKALQQIIAGGGWRLIKAGHWGHLRCDNGCCDIPVNGTPEVPSRDVRDIERRVRRCPLDEDDPRNKRRRDP